MTAPTLTALALTTSPAAAPPDHRGAVTTVDHAATLRTFTHQLRGAPLCRTPGGRLLALTALTLHVVDGQTELDLTGVQIDPRTLDPAQPEHRIRCRVPVELAPDWLIAAIAAAPGGRHA